MSERRKLIEVALPLEAINEESSRRKRKAPSGYPTTLHKWWAQRPLAACRAVLFASLVDDPSSRPDLYSEEDEERERQRLLRLIEELVRWENSTDAGVLAAARAEIERSTGGAPPPVLDPFCGGGSIPLEAQRLGLEVRASDLNPVAVLITKALTEIPFNVAGRPPSNPDNKRELGIEEGSDVRGLAEDVRGYGQWVRDEAWRRIGHLYPKAELPDGGEASVIAWLWARTVKCPNPACRAEMPLISSFRLATRVGKQRWIRPVVDRKAGRVDFEVSDVDPGTEPPKIPGKGRGFRCLVCGEVAGSREIHQELDANPGKPRLLAVVAQSERDRTYLSGTASQLAVARSADGLASTVGAHGEIPDEPTRGTFGGNAQGRRYGFRVFADYFTSRQLIALATFSALVRDARERVLRDSGDPTYADAVTTYLACAVSRLADYGNSLATWRPKDSAMRSLFAQQAMSMSWDFAEGNPFGRSSSGFTECIEVVAKVLERLPASAAAQVHQLDATTAVPSSDEAVVCSDPPYYDNIGYGDLADFFYVWLRRSLGTVYPDLFRTLVSPKAEELVANVYRVEGGKEGADAFFEDGLRQAFARMRDVQSRAYPLTLFYAFKQAESINGAVASTGWETMLTGLLESGLAVTGTWPMRTEGDNRTVSIGTAALASSILLVCRPRPADAPLATRREFVGALRKELPDALKKLQQGNVAPVDLAQAAIGPGMAVFSRYSKVVEADGSAMRVRTALGLINQTLDEIFTEQEGDFDADTRFAVTWFEQRGMEEGGYGEADVLARAKNTSVAGMVEAGVLAARAGKVRLLARRDMPDDWDPVTDRRPTAWEAAQHLTRRLEVDGEDAAADLLRRLGSDYGEQAKELAYRLFSICERKGWAQEAIGYNALVVAWPEIARRVAGTPEAQAQEALEV